MSDVDSCSFAPHPARPVDHLSSIASIIETKKISDILSSEKKKLADGQVAFYPEESVT